MMRTLIFTLLVFFAIPALAQVDTGFYGNQPDMSITPEFPRPGEEVTVELKVAGSKTFNSEIVWTINGQVVGDANNKRKVEFVAGPVGKVMTVQAAVNRPSGITDLYTVNVKPTYIDIVLEPQTRVPDFYQGRAQPTVGSLVNATVLVNDGGLIDREDLSYTWRLGGKVLEGGQIRGAKQVSFNTPPGSQSNLFVSVTAPGGKVLGRRAIYFETVKPSLEFYEINALYGQSHNAITDSLVLVGQAATIVAEPFNLDINVYNDPDINEWEIDRVVQSNNNPNPYMITIQKVNEGGSSEVSFHVRSTTEFLQGSMRDLKIVY